VITTSHVMDRIRIRQCSDDDVAVLAQLGALTFRDTFESSNTPENMKLYLETTFTVDKVREELKERGTLFFLAEEDHVPVGFAKVRDSHTPSELSGSRSLEIERIYATRNYIGKGLGQMLMRTCLAYAEQNDYETVWLGVWEYNDRAISFYNKWGFETFGQHVFMLGDDPQIDLLMKKKLI